MNGTWLDLSDSEFKLSYEQSDQTINQSGENNLKLYTTAIVLNC